MKHLNVWRCSIETTSLGTATRVGATSFSRREYVPIQSALGSAHKFAITTDSVCNYAYICARYATCGIDKSFFVCVRFRLLTRSVQGVMRFLINIFERWKLPTLQIDVPYSSCNVCSIRQQHFRHDHNGGR